MLAVNSQTVDRIPDERGSGRFTYLYGSDPAKNLATQRARQMSPDELRSAGYRQALNSGTMRGSLCNDPNYLEGWALGYQARRFQSA